MEILFLNILEEGDSKALLEDLPNFQESPIGLDIEKMKELFQKEEEYCSLKSTVSDYEKLLLEQNDKMNQASNENKRLSYELEKFFLITFLNYSLIIKKCFNIIKIKFIFFKRTNDEVCNLKTNLQSLLNSNIDFERENLELKAFLQEKSISLIGSLEKIKHYEDSLLKKNEDLAVTIEKSNSLEEENQKLKKQIEELYNENEDLKEKAFRNQIQQEQNEEIFKNFKFVLMKSAKELVKGFEEIDIREEIKRLEATETSSCDFSGFLNETENFEAETNHKVLESHRRELENFKYFFLKTHNI